MTMWTPSRANLERQARARRQRRDARVAHAALSRARRSVPTAAAYLRAEAQGYRAEANVFAGGDGGLRAWRAAERRERTATHLGSALV